MSAQSWKAKRDEWQHDQGQVLFYRAIGERIRELRRLHGWSQQTLGNQVGLTGPTIGMIESGRIRATLFHISRLASPLGVPLSDLVP